jgi:1-acyl-sn-glycerol-3-phosphate acyltransferase
MKYPIIGAYFKTLNIPVYRGDRMRAARSIVKASQEAKKGWSIAIFPEGGIPVENPKMKPFKAGAFQLAKNLNLPIVPLTFINNHLLFSDPTFILGPARPGFSKVYMHDYISAEQVASMDQRELKAYCFELLNGPLLERYPELTK